MNGLEITNFANNSIESVRLPAIEFLPWFGRFSRLSEVHNRLGQRCTDQSLSLFVVASKIIVTAVINSYRKQRRDYISYRHLLLPKSCLSVERFLCHGTGYR